MPDQETSNEDPISAQKNIHSPDQKSNDDFSRTNLMSFEKNQQKVEEIEEENRPPLPISH